MDYSFFSQQIPKIKKLPLPGEASHYKMAPPVRIRLMEESKLKKKQPKKAGVMALFYGDATNRTRLLLILRKTYQGVHSNQIGFPGGKAEKSDANILETALRETHEEVGVLPNRVKIIKSLSEVYIPPSNFEVQPYIGLYTKTKPFQIQESEVESLVEVRFTDFMDDSNNYMQNLTTSYAKNIDVPAFKLNGYTVWGATAMMLSEIKELLKQVF
ncbi:CoA pyrophosphatase [uncultured Kriegella sp.]|uniref:NUDIX hydrolase n=1 Tax=uncultured Kriegella sp. TaxID=1798910 RepID=UPI0030DD6D12|tara:strand:+ start:83785 stop:84426 length:642 start_codon:yes stop_codon:yes gene_type:complete